MEETKANIYDIIPVQKQGHYAVGTNRGLFILAIERQQGRYNFSIVHRNFNIKAETPLNTIRSLGYHIDTSVLIAFQNEQNLYLYNYETQEKIKLKNFIPDNSPYKIISMSELELQPIDS